MSDISEHPDARRWNRRYRESEHQASVLQVLRDYAYLLPERGEALDLACGLGANALFLAEHGLDSHAWDIAEAAIQRLAEESARRRLTVHAQVRDVIASPPPALAFDVIVVGHFLERDLAAKLMAALRPGGLLFYQTFNRLAVDDEGPGKPEYRLAENELLRMFPDLRVRLFYEAGRCGDIGQGLRNQSMYIGQKP